jgi:hypothetical protein
VKAKPKPKAAPAAEQTERQPPAFAQRLERFGGAPLAYVVVSILLLIPCFWQSRIHAGDLSSHIYNTWLTQLTEAGKTTGLTVAPQTTNVLFDLMLSALFRPFGASAAQRIAVSLAVLIFCWGAFYFIERLGGRRPWGFLPVIAILAYGWTFHMGFFNMYLSLGLCLWAMGAAWDAKPAGFAAAAVLLAIAYVAHGLPVAWAVALGAYTFAARRMADRNLPTLFGMAAAAIVLLRVGLESVTLTRWFPDQVFASIGALQVWTYDDKYIAVAAGMSALWVVSLYALWREDGIPALLHSVPFHFAVLTGFGILIIPATINIPGYRHSLAFIGERMSLGVGVCCLAAAARRKPIAPARYLGLALVLVYFGFLAHDDAILNRYEDQATAAVAGLRGQRVVSGFHGIQGAVDPFVHMVDRACLGVCYSYANYEPSTWQFRLRSTGPSPFVVSDYGDSYRLQSGDYVVKPSDLPLYRLDLENGGVVAHPLAAGQKNGATTLETIQ